MPKLMGLSQRDNARVGWRFQFAIEVLQQLALVLAEMQSLHKFVLLAQIVQVAMTLCHKKVLRSLFANHKTVQHCVH